jgi:hypothetical protein
MMGIGRLSYVQQCNDLLGANPRDWNRPNQRVPRAVIAPDALATTLLLVRSFRLEDGAVARSFRWEVGSGHSAPSVVPLNASLWKRSVPRQPTSQPKHRDNLGNRSQIRVSRMNTGRHDFMLAVN